ncbi:MAG: tyrosine-protein phosphatase [Pyrinomonadaceae bacterium]
MAARKQIIFLALAGLMFASLDVMAQKTSLPNFQKVNENLFRGGQPKPEGFQQLKELGVHTVIYLRSDDEKASKERELAEAAGLSFTSVPLGNWKRPAKADIEKVLAMINDAGNQPVFVHCKRGADRTGTVIAIYRMTHDGWDAKQASDEAEKFGIGWWQFAMRDFIHDYYRDEIQKKK